MAKTLFESSFLQETLQSNPNSPRDITLGNGVKMELLQTGILQITPALSRQNECVKQSGGRNSKHIVISSAIHGNETAPIEMVDTLASLIEEQQLTPVHHLLLIIAHPQSIVAEQRFIDTNLNRLFGEQSYPESLELAIADDLKACVSRFWLGTSMQARWHLDMHCSIRASKHYTFSIIPQSPYATRSKEFIEFMQRGRIEALLLSDEPSSTFSWYSASKFGAQAATVELGQVAKFGCNDKQKLREFNQALINLIQCEPSELIRAEDSAMIFYEVNCSIYRQHQEFELYFDKALANFSSFAINEVLGKDGNQLLSMPIEQGRIVFPNANVELKQRAALIVKPCATHYVDEQLTIIN
ncbi:succinylglutamate desuccinylase [Vibrio halioticoli NBRC 102217]|uniref:Succinylglutamate desuccinylase n=1 Tax=Vibrio halioticoli NBRC 102217 TaxID=1219072 RepID=V5FDS7_9VIBR|nr:succinylglutamate desuccinylase [Vibrio halioticoli]GAD89808.1 succinylglutamate desuccinylase [Vibrio halioticoli NBRC 102217]